VKRIKLYNTDILKVLTP